MSNEPDSEPGIPRGKSSNGISVERRELTNIALALTASGESLSSIARDFDRAEGDTKRAALFDVCKRLDELRLELLPEATELIREIANQEPTS